MGGVNLAVHSRHIIWCSGAKSHAYASVKKTTKSRLTEKKKREVKKQEKGSMRSLKASRFQLNVLYIYIHICLFVFSYDLHIFILASILFYISAYICIHIVWETFEYKSLVACTVIYNPLENITCRSISVEYFSQ